MGSLDAAGSGLYYRFIELQNSTFILSNDMYIQSKDEICILFWLGEESQIVLTTEAVRYKCQIGVQVCLSIQSG